MKYYVACGVWGVQDKTLRLLSSIAHGSTGADMTVSTASVHLLGMVQMFATIQNSRPEGVPRLRSASAPDMGGRYIG